MELGMLTKKFPAVQNQMHINRRAHCSTSLKRTKIKTRGIIRKKRTVAQVKNFHSTIQRNIWDKNVLQLMKIKANISCLSSWFLTVKGTIHKALWKAKGMTAATSVKEYSLMGLGPGEDREQNKTVADSLDWVPYNTTWYIEVQCRM